jgi:Cu(I)/Ag(I) efflux system protein CusF
MTAIHLLTAASLVVAFSAHAQAASTKDLASQRSQAASTAPSAALTTDGEVRKIDKEQGKVTLKHGPIPNLEMPGMTMVFKVADPKMLDSIKEGDKVTFAADRVNGAITITALEPAK